MTGEPPFRAGFRANHVNEIALADCETKVGALGALGTEAACIPIIEDCDPAPMSFTATTLN